jgi:methionine sulfoxide reductase heme-binding subunit
VALGHSLGSGTDRNQAWLLVIAVGCALAVLAALAWRLSARFTEYVRMERVR